MLQFQGFKPDALNRMAKTMGYSGDMGEFNKFLNENPEKQEMMDVYSEKAKEMMMGGYVKGYAEGGMVIDPREQIPQGSGPQIIDTRPKVAYYRMPDGSVATDYPSRVSQVIGPKDMGTPISQSEFLRAKNPNIEGGYYDSPEYNDFGNDRRNQIGTADVRYSPYFGRQGSGSVGGAFDQAYEAYLNRTGNTGYLQGGADFVQDPGYQAPQFGLDTVGPIQQVSGPSDSLNPNMPPATIMPVAPIPPGGYPKFKGPPENDQRGNDPTATAPPVGPVDYTQGPVPQSTGYQGGTITEAMANRAFTPGLPYGATVSPVGTAYNANQSMDTSGGQVSGAITPSVMGATTSTAAAPTVVDPRTMTASTAASGVQAATDAMAPAQGAVDPRAQVTGQQTTETSVEALTEAQGTATTMVNPVTRTIQAGEVVNGAANAETASTFMEQVQAAEATPTNKATVQGQLEGLMAAFEGGNTPAWAAGAMRNVTTQMANRGLGASSMAAQALIQGALESALPIAQADAQIVAQFEAQNLSNRQQRAMLAAQQRATFMGMEFDQSFQARVQNSARIGDIANMNFTADQQVALENSRIANTVNLANLSNSQAMIMAEASALANLDMSNLANRQQAAVQNAQNFMQMDMQNLSNQQQTDMFKGQQIIQSLFTDQAAENAAKQFNATSQSQTDQFFASLASTTSQFNASQANAQGQFNAGQSNTMNKFIAEVQNQREQFNAKNRLIIDQNNAQWRREIATADTVAINRANELNASAVLNMSDAAYKNLWQYYSDSMEWAWNSAENEQERWNRLALQQMQNDTSIKLADMKSDYQSSTSFGKLIGTLFTGGNKIFGSLVGGTSEIASVTGT